MVGHKISGSACRFSLFSRRVDACPAPVPDENNRILIKAEFVEGLEDARNNGPGMLLAGAVGSAVKETMEVFE